MLKPDVNFVIGIGRSGTTLLLSILEEHPEIKTTPECYFVSFFYNAYGSRKKFTEKQLSLVIQFVKKFELLQPYVGYHFDEKKVRETFQQGALKNYTEFCQLIYSGFNREGSKSKSPTILLDKNPSNTLYINVLLEVFPNARFILMVRDYRANILSRKQSINNRTGEIMHNALRWKYFNQKALKFSSKHPNKLVTLRYEDLVDNQALSLNPAYKLLGLSDVVNYEQTHKKEQNSFNTFESQNPRITKKYGDLSQPVFSDRKYAWKKELSSSEIAVCDYICSDIGSKFNYTSIEPTAHISLKEKIKISLSQIMLLLEIFKNDVFFILPTSIKLRYFNHYVDKIVRRRKA